MKSRILAAALLPFLLATPLHAQQQAQQPVTPQDPHLQALSQTVIDLTGQVVELRAQFIAAQTEIRRLMDEKSAAATAKEAGK